MIKIKPMEDWVVLERDEYAHPFLFVAGQKTHRGKVIAAGPGKWIRKFIEVEDPMSGKKFKTRAGGQTGNRKPMDVAPGDVVEFSDAGWQEHTIQGKKYVFTRQDSIIGFSDSKDPQGMQGHTSASV
jgi:co-chaperonin GroES (HSP10)